MKDNTGKNEIYENNIEKRKLKAINLYNKYLEKPKLFSKIIDDAISLDPVNSNIVFEYLKKIENIESSMLIKFYDILSKDQLIHFNIKKNMNNIEIFFY